MNLALVENDILKDFLQNECKNSIEIFNQKIVNLIEDYKIKKSIKSGMIEVKEAINGKKELKNAFTLLKELK